jgi:hypothetical protein
LRLKREKQETHLKQENANLRDALAELWSWVDNWSPEFVYDEEFHSTREKVKKALAGEVE